MEKRNKESKERVPRIGAFGETDLKGITRRSNCNVSNKKWEKLSWW
jgi:hypothetical protein